ncbi:ATP-binding protein [Anaerolinea sp.]|uniref:ATP-binding protein n=1 Tax=Anaerolinea sp. TaxID=1872519 RepID=UPI002ACDE58A|nr:tetratricopeptide repeat protein [Anaerolinea sp.]
MEVCTWEKRIPLPDTVREVIQARIRRLTPVGRQVLEAGAVIGPVFSFDFLRGIAGRREMEVVNGLDELVARQLLMERGVEYHFPHELVARVVEENLSPVRRQILHRRAGWTLARLDPKAVFALARHFDLGGEFRKALFYYKQAAQQAEALFAWKEAEECQNRMLVLLERLDPQQIYPDQIMLRGHILLHRAQYEYLRGRLEARDADLQAVKTLAGKLKEKNLYLLYLLHQVRYLNLGGQYQEAISLAEEGIRTLPIENFSSDSTLALLYVEIAFAHYLLGQPCEGFTALHSAETVAGENPDPKVQGPIEHQLGYMYLHCGEYAQALTHQQEALRYHKKVGDLNGIAWSELDIGFLSMKIGHFVEAKNHLDQSLSLARRIGAQPAEVYARTYSGYWLLHQGFYRSAAECFQQTIPIHRAVHQEHGVIAAEIGWGLVLYHLGETVEAREKFQHAVECARKVSHQRRLAEALIGRGLVELREGNHEAAVQILTEAVQLARRCKNGENLVAGLAALARAAREKGEFSSALQHAQEALETARKLVLPVYQMWAEMEMGLTYLAQGVSENALEHTSQAVHLLPQAYEAWIPIEEVYFAHVKVLHAVRDTQKVHSFLEQARLLVEKKSQSISDPSQRENYLRQKLPFFSENISSVL